MRIQSFTIPIKPVSWNVVMRMHWRKRGALFSEWNRDAFLSIKEAKIKRVEKYPVSLAFHAKWKKKGVRDLDNVMIKEILDSLKDMGILKDDSLAFVESVTLTGEVGAVEDALRVTIQEPD